MPKVSFIYPDTVQQRFMALKNRQEEDRKEKTIPETQEYLGNLDFGYSISGSSPWKPVRVYNDGTKTIIQMPPKMRQTEAPSLLVLNGDEEVIVNYRLQGDRFIVDQLFDKAMLIARGRLQADENCYHEEVSHGLETLGKTGKGTGTAAGS